MTALGPAVSATGTQAIPDIRRVIVLRNHRGELRRLAAWIGTVARENGLAVATAFRMDICLTEAVTNVIEHGFPEGGAHEIRVAVEPQGREIVLAVDDDGRPFDPLQALPRGAATLQELPVGGYGLHLLRYFADSWRYQRREGRNILTLTVPATSR